jgi:hypothetical protein
MQTNSKIADAVAEVYNWIDAQTSPQQLKCDACGKCCDFEGYDHRLFVTGAELIYFAVKLQPDKIKPMPASKCPYNINGKCTVYPYRFGSCRIFFCKADKDFQSKLAEEVLEKFKSICEEFNIPYCYADLASALNNPAV